MRSSLAGIAAILVFGALQWFAKAYFGATLREGGTGRDILSTIVLGGTFGTFIATWFLYPGMRRSSKRRWRSNFHSRPGHRADARRRPLSRYKK